MIFIVGVAIYISLAYALSCLTNRKIEETLAPTAFTMIIVLYISGLCRNLLAGEYILIAVSVIAIIFIFYSLVIRHQWHKLRLIFTPGGAAFLICLILDAIISKGRVLNSWDEFSHWGRVVLNMFQWNQLGNCAGSTVMFTGYPPAVSLWEYAFICLKDTFSEPYLYAACNLLIISLLLPVFKKVEWKQWGKSIVLFAVVLLTPLIFLSSMWSLLYMDGILGIWMIYILFAYFSEKENTPFKTVQISLAFLTYPLVKETGVGLAFLALFIIAMDIFVCTDRKSSLKQKMVPLLVYVCSIIVGKLSWTWYLRLTSTEAAWNSSDVSIEKVLSLFNGNAEEYQYSTIRAFIRAFLFGMNKEKTIAFGWMFIIIFFAIFYHVLKIQGKKQLLWYSACFLFCNMVYVAFAAYVIKKIIGDERWMRHLEGGSSNASIIVAGWIVIIVLFSLLVHKLGIWDKKQLLCYSGSFVACILIYAIFMLIVYCFSFSSYEAPRLASYERYMVSILLGIFGYVVCILVSESSGTAERITLLILLCLMLPADSVRSYVISLSDTKQNDAWARGPYENVKEFAGFMDWDRDKVYFIDQGSNGRSSVVCGYNATPIRFSGWGWSLGKPLYEGDVWTVDHSAQEWADILKEQEYTYVYVFHQEQQFLDNYSQLFENPDEIWDRTLYQVCEDSTGNIFLRLYQEY